MSRCERVGLGAGSDRAPRTGGGVSLGGTSRRCRPVAGVAPPVRSSNVANESSNGSSSSVMCVHSIQISFCEGGGSDGDWDLDRINDLLPLLDGDSDLGGDDVLLYRWLIRRGLYSIDGCCGGGDGLGLLPPPTPLLRRLLL